VNFEPLNNLKDFLRGSIENVLDDTVKILRRLRKKHWVTLPLIQGVKHSNKLEGGFFIALPKGTYMYSSSYEHLLMLGFNELQMGDVEDLEVDDVTEGYYIKNQNASLIPTQRDGVLSVQQVLGVLGRDFFREGSIVDLTTAVTMGFIRPEKRKALVYNIGFILDKDGSAGEFTRVLDKGISRACSVSNVTQKLRFYSVKDKLVFSKSLVSENPGYTVSIIFDPTTQNYLEFTIPSEIELTGPERNWESEEFDNRITQVTQEKYYPVTVHSSDSSSVGKLDQAGRPASASTGLYRQKDKINPGDTGSQPKQLHIRGDT
jgi:hypothetical protein